MQRRSRASSSTKYAAASLVRGVFPPILKRFADRASHSQLRGGGSKERVKQFFFLVNVLRTALHFLPMSMRSPCSLPAAAASSPPPLGVKSEAAARGRKNRKFGRKSGAKASCLRNRKSQPVHWQAVGWGEGQTMIMLPSSRYRLGSIYSCGNTCSRMGNALMYAKGNENNIQLDADEATCFGQRCGSAGECVTCTLNPNLPRNSIHAQQHIRIG